jgi:hypothetical protein
MYFLLNLRWLVGDLLFLNRIVLPVFVCVSKVFGMVFWGNLGNSTR